MFQSTMASPHLSPSEHSEYLASKVGLQDLLMALPIAEYCLLRSWLSIHAGPAMFMMSSFCWSVSFVILVPVGLDAGVPCMQNM